MMTLDKIECPSCGNKNLKRLPPRPYTGMDIEEGKMVTRFNIAKRYRCLKCGYEGDQESFLK